MVRATDVKKAKKGEEVPAGFALVEQLTAAYATKRDALVKCVTDLSKDVQAVEERYLKEIRRTVAETRDAKRQLEQVLWQTKPLFDDPRSRVFHGVRVGFRKLIGKVLIDDPAKVVERIKRFFKRRAKFLIITTEIPSKDALAQLTGKELKKLGVAIQDDTDDVVITAPKSAVEKLVEGLLADKESAV